MVSNENKKALIWTAGITGVIVVIAVAAYMMGWLTPAV